MICDNIKDLSNELKIIESIRSLDSTSVSVYSNHKLLTEGRFLKKKDNKCIELSMHLDDCENIMLKTEFNKPLYTSLFQDSVSTEVKRNKASLNCVCSFRYLKTKIQFDTLTSKFRCFIPTEKARLKTFHLQLETILYADNTTTHFYNCIRIEIDGTQFDVLQVKTEDIGYYVIDSLQEMTFKLFANYCYSIQLALGFVMGYMPGGYIFYFSEDKDFSYTNYCRPAMKTLHYPIDTNPHSFIQHEGISAENFKDKLNKLPLKCFSKLVSTINSNNLFSSAIAMIIEGESLKSLLVMPSIYTVALETLTKIICHSETGLEYPIRNKILFGRILEDINRLIDSYSHDFNKNDDIVKIKNRLQSLNDPINKSHLTNNEKLLRPFKQLGIKLSLNDINIIEHRNDLLHGNIHLSNDERKDTDAINNYMGYASAKLYTLVSTLILKHIDYSGYIINHAKAYEKYNNIDTEEDYYLLI